ncbi:MAG: FAD-dependent oxidoreductase [Geitlerinemataceae cyanobacterium]
MSGFTISRDLSTACSNSYDLIVVGGGVYGVASVLEAARRGLRPLLLERGDFGGTTSYHSLRIVHGGFRYLQTLDLPRFYESVGERRWFLQNFPELVKPLECLMPLYGRGIRKPPVLYAALRVNDILSFDRNWGIRDDRHLSDGKVISADGVKELFPQVDAEGLQGGAVWYDACMPDSQRLLMGMLRWACGLGATALNYVEAQSLLQEEGRVTGVSARDVLTGESYEYRANHVVNAAGPWCRELASRWHGDVPELFQASIAWNVLFDRQAPSTAALAVEAKKPGAQTYFLHPWKGRLLAGTVHDPWTKDITDVPMPSPQRLAEFIDDLNCAIPGLELTESEILRVFSGLLPAKESGSNQLAKREVIFDHAAAGGLTGLYSISGVKFTTARLVAEKTISTVFPKFKGVALKEERVLTPPPEASCRQGLFDYHWYPDPEDESWKAELSQLIAEESVQHLDDLVLRRTSLGDNPERAISMLPELCEFWDWDETLRQEEMVRVRRYYDGRKPTLTAVSPV